MNRIYWFKLPTEVRERLSVFIGGSATIESLLNGLTWFRFPEKLTELIEAINTELDTPYVLVGEINWANVRAQAEAFVLDLEARQRYGPELVTNGAFDTAGSGWNISGESTVSGGVGRILSTAGAYSEVFQSAITTIGITYRLEFDVISTDGVSLENSTSELTYPTDTTGHKVYEYVAVHANLSFKRPSICDVTIDNVSLRELDDNGTLIA